MKKGEEETSQWQGKNGFFFKLQHFPHWFGASFAELATSKKKASYMHDSSAHSGKVSVDVEFRHFALPTETKQKKPCTHIYDVRAEVSMQMKV